jgi:hypothetical protein
MARKGSRTLKILELWDQGERDHGVISRETGVSLKYVGQVLRLHDRRRWRRAHFVHRRMKVRRQHVPVPQEIVDEAARRDVPVSSLVWDVLSVVADQDLVDIVLSGETLST